MSFILFGVLPYVCVAAFAIGMVRRFRVIRDTVTTGSSQLLEGRLQFWGSVSWHYAILLVLALHLCAILAPGHVTAVLGAPARLLAVEVTGLALGVTAFVGLSLLVVRRFSLRGETTWLDWLVMALLLVQVATGAYTSATMRWGYAWFGHVATPWLGSLLRLSPQVDRIAVMPHAFHVHAMGAFLLLALVPYTRLAHALVAPIEYLWRLPQVVIWRRPRPAAPRGTR
jgi:nitrate reductase gamma subunit